MLPALIRDLHTSIGAGRDDAELPRVALEVGALALDGTRPAAG